MSSLRGTGHCTKKLRACSQKYVSESEFSDQIRGIVRSCRLHPKWKSVFDQWAEETLAKKKMSESVTVKALEVKLMESDEKLNRLLDAYLDQVIDPEIYRQKKNVTGRARIWDKKNPKKENDKLKQFIGG